ncbi:MAG: hypothetical protein KatS3mg101_0498 [Patescibacteria group bacterium]|nr:MAG: hypothetical protein KatS3mg101_0498 [Patescibacteria group bacterium]
MSFKVIHIFGNLYSCLLLIECATHMEPSDSTKNILWILVYSESQVFPIQMIVSKLETIR